MATPLVLVSPRILTDAQWQALYEHARQAPVWSHVFPLRTAVRSTPSFPGSDIHVMLVKRFRVTVDQNASPWHGGHQQTMVIRDVCPRCKSSKYKKNGHISNGKQNHHCHDCGRQFVQCLEQYLISDDRRALIERLLVERISLRGICRAVGVTLKWL